jgi:hypothetical protein
MAGRGLGESWLYAVSNEFGGGDQALVLGREVTAPDGMPEQ